MSHNGHKDGCPFHPTPVDHKGGHGGPRGISVRLWLAGQAMAALVGSVRIMDKQLVPRKEQHDTGGDSFDYSSPDYDALVADDTGARRIADVSLEIADALLAADAANPPKAVSP